MSIEDLNRDFSSLVSRYLSGELLPDQQTWFEEELRSDPEKQAMLDEYRKIWDSTVPEQSYNLDAEWDLMRKKLPDYKSGSARSLLFYTYRVAAVLVLGLLLSFSLIYLNRTMGMERVMAENVPVEVILEDGTEVIVNRHSSLRYSKKADQKERKVYLSGEAWFDVARDTTMPFVIDAGAALVEVLGTSFNVNAYKDNPTVEITVESGLVAMKAKEDQKDLIVMKAGSGGIYNKNQRELKLIPTSDPNSISWKTRELFFDASTLREVVSLVNSVYDSHIVITSEELASCPITVTFRGQTLEAILNVLELTLDLQLTREGDVISLDGQGCAD